MINLNDEVTRNCLGECREHMVTVEADLLALEQGGADIDEEVINRVFRSVHSIKGTASLTNFSKIPEISHQMENVLALIRSRRMIPTPDKIRVLLRAGDKLQELISDPASGAQVDISGVIASLADLYQEHRAPAGKEPSSTNARKPPSGRKLYALVVEDDSTSRILLQSFLSQYGKCDIAVNGKEAVAAFRSSQQSGNRYDLVCMDIMMPEMDGLTAVREIRAMEEAAGTLSSHGVKIIMTTALDYVKNVVQSFQQLCDAYVLKPIDTRKLLGHIRELHLV